MTIKGLFRVTGAAFSAAVLALSIGVTPASAGSAARADAVVRADSVARTDDSRSADRLGRWGYFKGRTDLTLDPAAGAALQSLGVHVTPLFASTRTSAGRPVFGFPIVGNFRDGTIEHLGGLALTKDHRYVFLTNYTIDLNRGVVTGLVNFRQRALLFTIGKATPDGVTLALTAAAAQVLNKTFGVTAFTKGLVIGYGNPVIRTR